MASNFNNDTYFEVLSRGETVNAERYIEFLKRMLAKFHHLAPNELILMHDNARPHVTQIIKTWFNDQGIVLLLQPPYSSDVNLMDRFVFHR